MDRRRFLKLVATGVAYALHAGVPKSFVRPVVKSLDLNPDFSESLIGLLVNARTAPFQMRLHEEALRTTFMADEEKFQ